MNEWKNEWKLDNWMMKTLFVMAATWGVIMSLYMLIAFFIGMVGA
jgi:hypothetical protein